MRKLLVIAGILLGLFVLLGVVGYLMAKSIGPRAHDRVVAALADRFDANVRLGSLRVSFWPHPGVDARELSIREKGWPDQPPLIYIQRFTASAGYLTLLGRRQDVNLVRLEGLDIHLPAHGSIRQAFGRSPEAHERKIPEQNGEPPEGPKRLRFLIEKIVADDTLLEIASKKPGGVPLRFEVAKLTLRSAGAGVPMKFIATLTNAKPPGLIQTTGNFGPWQQDDPPGAPVSGDYTFQHADLNVFKGISGILSSTGNYRGRLGRIEVQGTTDTPAFALRHRGQPVHLVAAFHSIVDGMDGDTYLDPVDARFGASEFICRGSVAHQAGPPGKTVALLAHTGHARIEDILHLVLNDETPPLRGDVDFESKIVIPPGKEEVVQKLDLEGRFSIESGRFTNPVVERRVTTLSLRARGIAKDEEHAPDRQMIASNLKATFRLRDSVARFSELAFEVPGATVRLAGDCNLRSEAIDMKGVFRMRATLADTQSGIKRLLLKPVDPLFEKHGAGFEVPIAISGTLQKPVVGAFTFHKEFTIR